MIKSFAKFLMHVTGLYALVGYTLLALWFVGIMLSLLLGEVAFSPSLIPNTINLIDILIINGAEGLIASLVFVGQFFFAYKASHAFKRLSQIDTPYTSQEREEYLTYLLPVAILIVIIILL